MSAKPDDRAADLASVPRSGRSLAISGLLATSVAFVTTFFPWVQIQLGLISRENSLLLGLAAPALGLVALLGCGCSTAATLIAGRGGSPVTSALGFGGFVLAVGYGVALLATGLPLGAMG